MSIQTSEQAELERLRAEVERLDAAVAAAERAEHVYTLTKTGIVVQWQPTAAAFSMGDGTHKLYTQPPAISDQMVERAALAIASNCSSNRMEIARDALEAALGVKHADL